MRKITLMGVLGMLLPLLSVKAQNIKPLSIGDTIPDLVLPNVINYKDSVIRLSNFKDKLVILDFFATWCGPCIESIEKLTRYASALKDSVLFVLVTEEKSAVVRQKEQALLAVLPPNVVVVTDDTVLSAMLPHSMIPHLVWAGPGSVVLHGTGSGYLTLANIRKVLYSGNFSPREKVDILHWDKDSSRLSDLSVFSASCISIKMSPRLEGLFTGGSIHRTGDRTVRQFLNQPLGKIYGYACPESPEKFPLLQAGNGRDTQYCVELEYPSGCPVSEVRQVLYAFLNGVAADSFTFFSHKHD